MAWTTIVAIYFIIWWVVLFAVLPWGVHSQQESGEVAPGTDPGAPAIHKVWHKLGWTTIIASLIFAMFYVVYAYQLITMDELMALVGPPR